MSQAHITRPWAALAVAGALLAACRSQRVLHVDSDPPGAVVRLDEEVIGVTPLRHEFVHGGQRRVGIYRPGFQTWSQRVDLEPPWYSRFPMDIVTEVLVPLGLHHHFEVDVRLVPDTGQEEGQTPAVDAYVQRALALREQELRAAREPGD